MKKLFLIFLLLSPTFACAYVNREMAVVRVMNKDAGKVQELTIAVGQELQFEKMYINVRACKQTDPFDAENHWAFLEITENTKGQVFGGWMNRNEPGDNPLQHPDYDVWLVRCQ